MRASFFFFFSIRVGRQTQIGVTVQGAVHFDPTPLADGELAGAASLPPLSLHGDFRVTHQTDTESSLSALEFSSVLQQWS